MTDIRIAPALPADIPALGELAREVIESCYRPLYGPGALDWFRHRHSPRAIARELGRGALILAAWAGARPVATGTLDGDEIRRVFVAPGRQREGLGRAIMDRLEDEAARRGLRKVALYTTPASHGYYLRRGYETLCAAAENYGNSPLSYYSAQKWLVPVPAVDILPAAQDDAEEMRCRQAQAFAAVAAMYRERIPPVADTAADLRRAIREHVVLKAVCGGRIAGGVRGLRPAPGTGHIARLFVSPGHRNRGLGSRLVYEAERALGECGEFELFTGSRNRKNLRLYRSIGYREERREPCGDYMLVYMRKRNPFVREVDA